MTAAPRRSRGGGGGGGGGEKKPPLEDGEEALDGLRSDPSQPTIA
jgi:hypothetical protein